MTHIWKEDFLLFPLAQQSLSTTEQQDLQEEFEDVEREVGEDVHAGFEMLAQKLHAVVEIATPVPAHYALRRREVTIALRYK